MSLKTSKINEQAAQRAVWFIQHLNQHLSQIKVVQYKDKEKRRAFTRDWVRRYRDKQKQKRNIAVTNTVTEALQIQSNVTVAKNVTHTEIGVTIVQIIDKRGSKKK
jgi:hypothetical protein